MFQESSDRLKQQFRIFSYDNFSLTSMKKKQHYIKIEDLANPQVQVCYLLVKEHAAYLQFLKRFPWQKQKVLVYY